MTLYEGLSLGVAILSAIYTYKAYTIAIKANKNADIAIQQIQDIKLVDNGIRINANKIDNSGIIAHKVY